MPNPTPGARTASPHQDGRRASMPLVGAQAARDPAVCSGPLLAGKGGLPAHDTCTQRFPAASLLTAQTGNEPRVLSGGPTRGPPTPWQTPCAEEDSAIDPRTAGGNATPKGHTLCRPIGLTPLR